MHVTETLVSKKGKNCRSKIINSKPFLIILVIIERFAECLLFCVFVTKVRDFRLFAFSTRRELVFVYFQLNQLKYCKEMSKNSAVLNALLCKQGYLVHDFSRFTKCPVFVRSSFRRTDRQTSCVTVGPGHRPKTGTVINFPPGILTFNRQYGGTLSWFFQAFDSNLFRKCYRRSILSSTWTALFRLTLRNGCWVFREQQRRPALKFYLLLHLLRGQRIPGAISTFRSTPVLRIWVQKVYLNHS